MWSIPRWTKQIEERRIQNEEVVCYNIDQLQSVYDNYDAGFNMTINAVETNGMKYMGVRKSVSEKTYMIQEINGIKIGIFNYVFNTGAKEGKDISINSIPVNNATAPLIKVSTFGICFLLTSLSSLLTSSTVGGIDLLDTGFAQVDIQSSGTVFVQIAGDAESFFQRQQPHKL